MRMNKPCGAEERRSGLVGIVDVFARYGKPTWILLAIAVVFEVVAATCMKMSCGFTDLLWTLATIATYCVSFFLLAKVLQQLPISLTYGIWGGAGTVATAVIGKVVWNDTFNIAMAAGIAVVIIGIIELSRGFAAEEDERANAQR